MPGITSFRPLILLFFLSHIPLFSGAQVDLSYYFHDEENFNKSVSEPKEIIGHEVGEWHITHDRLVRYMEHLAEASPRVNLEVIGTSYEGRPLQILTISSPKNIRNLQEIRKRHLRLTEYGNNATIDDNMPVVIFMGYSVHGNEASGSNAALLAAYYFAAAESVEKDLENAVILLHPVINPDGLNRFSSWVNSHKSYNVIADPNDHEHDEAWPGGRTNHYWFDLNRDWLPVQLKESKARMEFYHKWKPNILTDHHEMGTNSTFFFQPGIPSRNHPLTPEKTYELTARIAEYHAAELDKIGSLYYTREGYDDFYLGKGSAFPDVNGGVGILFEQASSRGHAQESVNGKLDFQFAIRNQLQTSISTFKAGVGLRSELLGLLQQFYSDAKVQAEKNSAKAYIFTSEKDQARSAHLVEILQTHEIKTYSLASDATFEGKSFPKEESYVVRLDQAQHRLIRGIFETTTSFQDSLFYDVSSWTLPLAFGLDYAALDSRQLKEISTGQEVVGSPGYSTEAPAKSEYAYLFEWHPYYAPAALNKILEMGIRAKASDKRFRVGSKEYDYGTIMIPVANQTLSANQLHDLMSQMSHTYGIKVYPISTGLNFDGIDIGSPSFQTLREPKIAMLIGSGVSSYEAGEVWHLTDQRLNMKVTKLTISRFNSTDLSRYNTLIMVNGSYGSLNADKLKRWVQNGGVVVATKSATRWFTQNGFSKAKFIGAKRDTLSTKNYDEISRYTGAQRIGGSIFEAELDLSHPLCYGYTSNKLPVFKNSTLFLEKSSNPYANPVRYSSQPLLSGYISSENLKRLNGAAVATTASSGRGKIVMITDNPNFRAFWYGTNKLFLNGIFFGHLISSRAAE